MDGVSFKQRVTAFLGQYRYVVIVLLAGLALMLIPGQEEETQPQAETQPQTNTTQEALEEILGQIDGVGRVQVMLTIAAGEQTVYEYSEVSSGDSLQREAVVITDENRAEQGLVQQVIPPVYQGAIVVCQGGDRASVRLAVVEAVASVTGLGTNQITVLKMK